MIKPQLVTNKIIQRNMTVYCPNCGGIIASFEERSYILPRQKFLHNCRRNEWCEFYYNNSYKVYARTGELEILRDKSFAKIKNDSSVFQFKAEIISIMM